MTAERHDGRCLCGTVRFVVTPPFTDAGCCHCRRCQIRTGRSASYLVRAPRAAVQITDGEGELRVWRPGSGNPKWFCGECGTHLFAGELDNFDGQLGLRPGTLDPMPEVTPRWHIWVSSMPAWDTMPDDGAPRYDRELPA